MERLEPTAAGLARARELLCNGSVVGIPTDTVYGLAALASDREARELIYVIKRRPADRSLVLLLADIESAQRWVEVDRQARQYMDRWWPGALTLVLPTQPGMGESATTAIRVPAHPVTLALLREAGEALATTSANRSGEEPALLADQVLELDGVAAVLDGGPAPGGRSSTVLDLTGAEPRVLRQGPIVP